MFVLQASTFQMAVLLQYNQGDNYSVQQLHESTQIKMVSTCCILDICLSAKKQIGLAIDVPVFVTLFVWICRTYYFICSRYC